MKQPTGTTQIRITTAVNDALKKLVSDERLRHMSAAGLADTLLCEACAASSGGGAHLPTVLYLRTILGVPEVPSVLEQRIDAIERGLRDSGLRDHTRSPSLNEPTGSYGVKKAGGSSKKK